MFTRQPILQQTCAVASTAAESRYRIDFNDFPPRDSRILALDAAAALIVRDLASRPWDGGQFLLYDPDDPENGSEAAWLRTLGGQKTKLVERVAGSDSVIMIATEQADPRAAELIGDVCAEHSVMSAAFLVGSAHLDLDATLRALRPNAMVLVLVQDEADLPDFLTALRV